MMKYIMFTDKSGYNNFPIIFPENLSHDEVAKQFENMGLTPKTAGICGVYPMIKDGHPDFKFYTGGNSFTLSKKSDKEDGNYIYQQINEG